MSALSASDKKLLNNFTKQQPALQRAGVAGPAASLELGDMLASASSSVAKKGSYSFAVHGGAVGDIDLKVSVPAGVLITACRFETLAAVTSVGGAATVAVKVGSSVIVAAVDAETTFAGSALGSLTTAVTKTASTSALKITIAGEALTAGKFALYLEYIQA